MARPSKILISTIKRNQRLRGPTSSEQQNDLQNELVRDLSTFQQEWNNKIVGLCSVLPDGTQDKSVDAFLNGLDGQTEFVKSNAQNSGSTARFYNSVKSRPNTIYEQFVNAYEYIDNRITNISIESGSSSEVADNSITFAKLQDITTDRLIGRDTAGTGTPEEIAVTNGLAFTGSQSIGIADGGVTLARMASLSANTLIGSIAGGTPEEISLTAAGRTLIAAASASAQRTALGLGTIATQDANNVAITGGSITGMSSPSVTSDVATKGYVDGLVAGLKWKQSVKAASTANGTLSTAFENGDTLDGVTLSTGDRILLKNQTDQTANGIYTVNASGAPTRATDMDSGTEFISAAVFVEQGSTNADKAFVCTNNSVTLGSDNITFVAFASAVGALIATNNLSDVSSANTSLNNLLPSQTSNSGKFLTTDGSNSSWATVTTSSPGGSSTELQFNNSSSFGGVTGFTYNSSTKALAYAPSSPTGNVFTLTGGTLASTQQLISATATLSSTDASQTGLAYTITTAGSGSNAEQRAAQIVMAAGYTGTAPATGVTITNNVASTSTTVPLGTVIDGGVVGIRSFVGATQSTGNGYHVAVNGYAQSGKKLNLGLLGKATVRINPGQNSGWDIGVMGQAHNGDNTGGANTAAGFFRLGQSPDLPRTVDDSGVFPTSAAVVLDTAQSPITIYALVAGNWSTTSGSQTSSNQFYFSVADPINGDPLNGGVTGAQSTHNAYLNVQARGGNITNVPRLVRFIGGSADNAANDTEIIDIEFDLNRTVKRVDQSTQRAFVIRGPIYSGSSSARTITNAATVSITSVPTASGTMSLTNSHGLLIETTSLSSVTNGYGLTVNAPTGATNNFAAKFVGATQFTDYLEVTAQTAPTTPSSGFGRVYEKSSDKKLYFKNSDGTEYDLTDAGSGTIAGSISQYQVAVGTDTDEIGGFSTLLHRDGVTVMTGSGAVSAGSKTVTGLAYIASNVASGLAFPLEVIDGYFKGTGTITYTGGGGDTLDKQRTFVFAPRTYSVANTDTITTAATVSIQGPPGTAGLGTIDERLSFWVESGVSRFSDDVIVSPFAFNGGTPDPGFLFTGPAHTNLTASTEVIDIDIDLDREVNFSSGTKTTQRAAVFRPPTYSFDSAAIITSAATLAISGAPVAGTNCTISQSAALWVQGGLTRLSGDLRVSGETKLNGSVSLPTLDLSGPLTLGDGRTTLFVSTAGSNKTITVPLAADFPGTIFIVKKVDIAGGDVELTRSGSDQIEGANVYSLSTLGESVMIQSDGDSNWWIIASN